MTDEVRQTLLLEILKKVPLNGWREEYLTTSASELGVSETELRSVFPNGVIDLLDFYALEGDRQMQAALDGRNLDTARIRERVATAVRLRLEVQADHIEATRSAIAVVVMPAHAAHGARILYRTVDCIWYAIGDSATDINFYTKRGLLAAVYASTLMFWLNDKSQDNLDTWSFLKRRIDNVMSIQKFRSGFKPPTKYMPIPLRTLCALATKKQPPSRARS